MLQRRVASFRSRLIAGAAWAALAYPAVLLGIYLALRGLGERWWVTGVGLYLPHGVLAIPLPATTAALFAARRGRLVWTQGVAAALLAFPLMGLVVRIPRGLGPDEPHVRVLSYNVESGEGSGGYPAVVAEIDRYAADIVFLVATTPAEALRGAMRARYPSVASAGQFLVASRFPILESMMAPPIVQGGQSYESRFFRAVLDTPLGHVVAYAVHPISPHEPLTRLRQMGLRGLLFSREARKASIANFYANRTQREAQVAAFAEAARREHDPVLIAGDTNLPDLSRIRREHLADFTDGFEQAGWGFGYTFPSDHRGPAWMRIDRFLSTPSLRFTRVDVGTSRASDHHCIVAEIRRARN
ncbi:MAG: endonuclease/exonuclease/phosphatase family protein [Polyangiaceae bacterium]|nr:endonuclease/exonuclease/phosphatase family protein [Polyangiaceae bacterium]